MGYLFHILIALGAEALGELGYTTGWDLPWGLLILLPVPHLLASFARRCLHAGRFARALSIARLVQLSPPVLQLVLVCVFGWVQSTSRWTEQQPGALAWPSPGLFVALAPFVVFTLIAIDAESRIQAAGVRDQKRVRAFQVRMFLSALLPLGLYFGLAGIVAASDFLRVHVEHVALYNAVFMVVLLCLLALAMPTLMRNTWETLPIPEGPQRSLLEEVAERARFRARELLVWRTGNLMTNAAIVGVWPSSRVVLFSDALLSILSLRELAAVFAHEMGHAIRRHVWIFIAWALGFFMAADLAAQAVADFGTTWSSLTLVFVLGAWAISFGWMSRRFELEADLFSLELLDDPKSLILALERVGGRNRDKGGWRHFSTRRRVDFLLKASGDRAWARRFRARLRVLALLGAAFAAAMAGLQLKSLVASYSSDRVWAELSLGEYSAAVERALHDPPADEDLRALVGFAKDLTVDPSPKADVEAPDSGARVRRGPERSVVELEQLLERALAAGELARAKLLGELLVLRGKDELRPLVGTLVALGQDDRAAAAEQLGDCDAHWRAALTPWVER